MGVVAAVGPHEFEPGETFADFVENKACAVPVLQARGMDHDAPRQTSDVDQGAELATLHLLAGVVPHCVVFTPAFTPPFSAAFSDWLSMIAAVGLASRLSALTWGYMNTTTDNQGTHCLAAVGKLLVSDPNLSLIHAAFPDWCSQFGIALRPGLAAMGTTMEMKQ
jgi:hypothetical protein